MSCYSWSQVGCCLSLDDVTVRRRHCLAASFPLSVWVNVSIFFLGTSFMPAPQVCQSCILHVDMDCFFASVGIRHRPELRGNSRTKSNKCSRACYTAHVITMWWNCWSGHFFLHLAHISHVLFSLQGNQWLWPVIVGGDLLLSALVPTPNWSSSTIRERGTSTEEVIFLCAILA